jgi:hypothetical protein
LLQNVSVQVAGLNQPLVNAVRIDKKNELVYIVTMSPTIFREKGYRFYFLSNEEPRIHVHVTCDKGEAKFWLEPIVTLATSFGLNPRKLSELQKIIEEHENEIVKAWRKHFSQC